MKTVPETQRAVMGRPWAAVRQGTIQRQAPVRKVMTKGSPKGAGKGHSKGGKGGSGAWVFVPSGANISSVISKMQLRGRPGAVAKKPLSKYEEKLRTIDSSLKVWIGGLTPNTTWKDVEKHFATVAKPSITEIRKNGTAVAAYKTAEEVETVVAELNGSELKGSYIEVDVWVQKPKTEKTKVDKDGKTAPKKSVPVKGSLVKKMPVKQVAKVNPKAKAKAKAQNDKMKEKLAAVPATMKVWIGGLSEGTTWKQLEAHMSTVMKPKLSHIHKNTGICVYETEEDVANAVAMMDGTELNGNRLQVDVWTLPEKREPKVKVKQQVED